MLLFKLSIYWCDEPEEMNQQLRNTLFLQSTWFAKTSHDSL